MNILFIADVCLEKPTSGAEQVLYQQVKGLTDAGVKVWAITRCHPSETRPSGNMPGVRAFGYRSAASSLPGFLLDLFRMVGGRLQAMLASRNIDAIVAHQPVISLLRLCPVLRNRPLVYVFHSPWHEEYLLKNGTRRLGDSCLPVILRKQLERHSVRRAARVIVLSEYMRRRVLQTHGVDPSRIRINPGGADLQRFHCDFDRNQLKRRHRFPPNRIHLLTIRNLERRMGVDRLIECMSLLQKTHPQLHLVIGGTGSQSRHLQEMIRRRGLSENVRLAGFLPHEILPEYYCAADFFIMPSQSLEGFGLVSAESLACGTPVLGTPVGGTPEILNSLNPDFVFRDSTPQAMADGIQRNIANYFYPTNAYRALRQECRRYAADRYSWNFHVDMLMELLGCLAHPTNGLSRQPSAVSGDHRRS